jgi:hypothetical protein
MTKSKFFILNGVRRALVAREAGRKTISAIIYREGKAPQKRPRMRLSQLHSPKHAVEMDDRYLSIELPLHEPITVEPLRARGQQSSTPLGKVILK